MSGRLDAIGIQLVQFFHITEDSVHLSGHRLQLFRLQSQAGQSGHMADLFTGNFHDPFSLTVFETA